MMDERPDDLLTIAEAEAEFAVKWSTLERWARQGFLPMYRYAPDKRTYLRRAELERVLEAGPPRHGS